MAFAKKDGPTEAQNIATVKETTEEFVIQLESLIDGFLPPLTKEGKEPSTSDQAFISSSFGRALKAVKALVTQLKTGYARSHGVKPQSTDADEMAKALSDLRRQLRKAVETAHAISENVVQIEVLQQSIEAKLAEKAAALAAAGTSEKKSKKVAA